MSNPRIEDTRAALVALRWDVDQRIVNYFGDVVWLGPCFDESGKRIGITECCFAESPCDHHRSMEV